MAPTLAEAAASGYLPPDSTIHLDRGYAGRSTETLVADHALVGVIARKGVPALLQVGQHWVVERTQSWMKGYGKLRRCTEQRGPVVRFNLSLADALVVTRCLIREARTR